MYVCMHVCMISQPLPLLLEFFLLFLFLILLIIFTEHINNNMSGDVNTNMSGDMNDNMNGDMNNDMSGDMNNNVSDRHLMILTSLPLLWLVFSRQLINLVYEVLVLCSLMPVQYWDYSFYFVTEKKKKKMEKKKKKKKTKDEEVFLSAWC